MRKGLTIWRREVSAGFLSPVGYVAIVLFLAIGGWVFLQLAEGHSGTDESLVSLLVRVVVFLWLPVLATLITMRTFAEEKHRETIETLLTAPVTEAEVVLGKYAGALSFLLLVTLPALAGFFVLIHVSPGLSMARLDWGALGGGLLFLVLMAANCVAIGLLMSLLTKNQVVAAMGCFAAILAPLVIGQALAATAAVPSWVADAVSADLHLKAFCRGLLDTRPIVFYVSVTAFLLFLSIRVLEVKRWK